MTKGHLKQSGAPPGVDADSKAGRGALGPLSSAAWLQVALAAVLVALGIYWFAANISLASLQSALGRATLLPVALALAVVGLNTGLKTWRWQSMWPSQEARPPFGATLAALAAGQFANLLLPIRVGEVVRIYGFPRLPRVRKATVAGTLVLEKTLDALTLLLSAVLLVPFLVLPAELEQTLAGLGAGSLLLLALLVIVVWQSEWLGRIVIELSAPLPERWAIRVKAILAAGLLGLSALSQKRKLFAVASFSVLVLVTGVVTPWLLFRGFQLPLGWPEAILLNLVVSLGLVPPSTPGKLLVFEAIVLVTLRSLGLADDALLLSYAVFFHLVVILPQLLLGGPAMAKLGLRLSELVRQRAAAPWEKPWSR